MMKPPARAEKFQDELQIQWPRAHDQGEPPSWRKSAVVKPGEGCVPSGFKCPRHAAWWAHQATIILIVKKQKQKKHQKKQNNNSFNTNTVIVLVIIIILIIYMWPISQKGDKVAGSGSGMTAQHITWGSFYHWLKYIIIIYKLYYNLYNLTFYSTSTVLVSLLTAPVDLNIFLI